MSTTSFPSLLLPFLDPMASLVVDSPLIEDLVSLEILIHSLRSLGAALHAFSTTNTSPDRGIVMVISTAFDRETLFCPTAMEMLNFVPSANFTFLKGHDVDTLARSAFVILRSMTLPSVAKVSCPFCPLFPDFKLLAQELRAQFTGTPGSGLAPPFPPRSAAALLLANDRRELLCVVASMARGVGRLVCTNRAAARHLAPVLAALHRICQAATPRMPTWGFDSTIAPPMPAASTTRPAVHPAISRMFSSILHDLGDLQPL